MNRLSRLAIALVAPLTLVSSTSLATSDPQADGRREFLAAYAQAGAAPAGVDSETLRNYPLYPYLEAERLQRRFRDPSVAPDIRAFLDRHGEAPVAQSLRRSWLMELALRKQWSEYLAVYREDLDDTVAGRCNAFAAGIALGRTDGLAEKIAAQ